MSVGPLILVFDTETTGLPIGEDSVNEESTLENWPKIVQLSYILYNPTTMEIISQSEEGNDIIRLKPDQYPIPKESSEVHGITDEISMSQGRPIEVAIGEFIDAFNKSNSLVAHNIQYDINVVCAELLRLIRSTNIDETKKNDYNGVYKKLKGLDPDFAPEIIDTLVLAKKPCNVWPYKYSRDSNKNVIIDKITAEDGNIYDVKRKEYFERAYSPKGPNLEEAHIALFNEQPNGRLHSALVDVAACLRVYMKIDPLYNTDICSPKNSTPSNIEICRIINPGPPLQHKIPKLLQSKPQTHFKRKGGKTKTKTRKTKTIKTGKRNTHRKK
jgi:DNA polymerase III epsilon subunit-like protein